MRILFKILVVAILMGDALASFARPLEYYGLSLCNEPQYRCISLKPDSNWYAMFPNSEHRDLVMRLNRTNVALRYRQWLIIPRSFKNLDYMRLAPFPQQIKPEGERLVYVDLRIFAFAAYDREGKLVYWGPASGGRNWCEDTQEDCATATGRFRVYRMQGEDCVSSKYPVDEGGGAEMPYCMHYFKGYAIHGSTLIGFVNRSRGCVRVFNADAKWLNEKFVQRGTRIIVQE